MIIACRAVVFGGCRCGWILRPCYSAKLCILCNYERVDESDRKFNAQAKEADLGEVYCQKLIRIHITMFSLGYNYLHLQIVVFLVAQCEPSYLHKGCSSSSGDCHVELPCFYITPKGTFMFVLWSRNLCLVVILHGWKTQKKEGSFLKCSNGMHIYCQLHPWNSRQDYYCLSLIKL